MSATTATTAAAVISALALLQTVANGQSAADASDNMELILTPWGSHLPRELHDQTRSFYQLDEKFNLDRLFFAKPYNIRHKSSCVVEIANSAAVARLQSDFDALVKHSRNNASADDALYELERDHKALIERMERVRRLGDKPLTRLGRIDVGRVGRAAVRVMTLPVMLNGLREGWAPLKGADGAQRVVVPPWLADALGPLVEQAREIGIAVLRCANPLLARKAAAARVPPTQAGPEAGRAA